MPSPEVDVAAMLAALDEHRVQYVAIGGFAVELHDVAVPPTRDVDITPARTGANLRRLAAALEELGARFRVADGPARGVAIPGGITAEWISGMVTLSLITDAGPLNVSLVPDGTGGYEDLAASRVEISFGDRMVPSPRWKTSSDPRRPPVEPRTSWCCLHYAPTSAASEGVRARAEGRLLSACIDIGGMTTPVGVRIST